MKKRVAITGGIASGKSTAIRYIKSLGYPVFSCDEIYKQVIEQKEYIEKVAKAFPACIDDGRIDRKILSDVVFNDKQKLRELNSIAHPLIMKELYKQMNECASPYVFAEVPLLFEGGYEEDFDEVIVITRSLENRINDLMSRDRISKENAEKRIASQFDYDSESARTCLKKCKAIVIKNEGTVLELEKQLEDAISQNFPQP